MSNRILIVGLGGLGGVIGANLKRAGQNVTILARKNSQSEKAAAEGIEVFGFGERFTEKVPIITELKAGDKYNFILMAVQPNRLLEAARQVNDALADRGYLAVLQNGLCEQKLVEEGLGPVIGCVVAFGGRAAGEAVFERTSSGGFTIGFWDDTEHPPEKLTELAGILETLGPVKISSNLKGARWSKLAINASISPLGTIYGDRLGGLLKHRIARRIVLETMSETVEAALKENVQLEKVGGTLNLEWIALTDLERTMPFHPRLWAKHLVLYLVGFKFRKMRSSMLRDLEQGRLPPVADVNGEVIRRGEQYKLPTPFNQGLKEGIEAIHKGERRHGLGHLKEIHKKAGLHRRGSRHH